MIYLGLIGCGVIGRKHLEAATTLPDVTVTTVADLDPELLARTAAEFGIEKATTEADDLIRDPRIDGIIVAVPTGVRTPIALEVLRHGKHLLVEKPVAMNAGEVQSLIDQQGGKIAGSCSCRYRFLGNTATVQSTLAAGRIGKLRTVRVRALFPPPGKRPENPPAWRLIRRLNGGGILVNWGSYDLDFVLGVLGWTIRPMAATARTFSIPDPYADWIAPGSDAETHVIAQVRCEEDIVLNYERAEFHPGEREFSWSFSGDRGTLSVLVGDENVRTKLVTIDKNGALEEALLSDEPIIYDDIHSGPVTDFAQAIESGGATRTPLSKALTIARITDAIYTSAENGGRETQIKNKSSS